MARTLGTGEVIRLARKHLGSDGSSPEVSSARLALADAVKLYDEGDFVAARQRALRSLAYSVGVFHADYNRAAST